MPRPLPQLVRVGVTTFRYVSHLHARPWIIYSYKNLKGRGVAASLDEYEDVVQPLSLKDFPGAPTLPEDRAIRPSKPSKSQPRDGSTALLIDKQETSIMIASKRCAENEDDSPPSKMPKTTDGETESEAATCVDAANGSHSAANPDDHNVVVQGVDNTSVMKPPSKTGLGSSVETAAKSPAYTGPPSGKYLLRTVTPDQQIVEQKFVGKDELSLTGVGCKGIFTKKTQKNETTDLRGEPKADSAVTSSGLQCPQTSDFPVTSNENTVPSTSDQLTTQLPSSDAAKQSPVMTCLSAPSTSGSDVMNADPASVSSSSVLTSVTARTDSASSILLSPSKVEVMTTTMASSNLNQGSTSVTGTTPPSSKSNYSIKVKLPSNTNMKDVDIAGILKQVQGLIKSGTLVVSGTKAQVLTVDIGRLKILVSVVPKTGSQTSAATQHTSSSTSTASPSTMTLQTKAACQQSPTGSHEPHSVMTSVPPLKPKTNVMESSPVRRVSSDGTMVVTPSLTVHESPVRTLPSTPAKGLVTPPVVTSSKAQAVASTQMPPDDCMLKKNELIEPRPPQARQSSDVVANSSAVVTTEGLPVRHQDEQKDEKSEENESALENKNKDSLSRNKYAFGHGLGAPPAKGTYQPVRLVCRPWKTPEGTVNRPILQMMLEGLLAYIMTKPGITWAGLIEKYSPIMQPVPLMELVEMLEEIGCVHKVQIKSFQKPTVFSRRVTWEADTLDDATKLIESVLPTYDCVLKMGQFVSQINSNRK